MHPSSALLVAALLWPTGLDAQDPASPVQEAAIVHVLGDRSASTPPRVCLSRRAVPNLSDLDGPPLPGASADQVEHLRRAVAETTGFSVVPYCMWNHHLSDLALLPRPSDRISHPVSLTVPDFRPVDPYGHWTVWILVSDAVFDGPNRADVGIVVIPHWSSTYRYQCTFERTGAAWIRVGECRTRREIA